VKAIILAAGAGTRLRPLTDACPKPMLPIAGRPLLAHTLDWLRRHGVTEAALNLHHLPGVVRDGLGDGGAWCMALRYSYEPELLGTAGAVRTIAERFPGWIDRTFLVIYGDLLLDLDLQDLAVFHQANGAALTMALKRTATPRSQGMVEVDAQGRVRRFVEKPPAWEGGDLANAGVYLCEPAVLGAIPPGFSDFGHDVIPAMLAKGAPVYGRLARGYLLDIGTPEAYAQAQRDWESRPARAGE
jgi:NDP-sugar pyrophosphorylase family protein